MFVLLNMDPRRAMWSFHVLDRGERDEIPESEALLHQLAPAFRFHRIRHELNVGRDHPDVDEFEIGVQPGGLFITSVPVPA